MRTTLASLVDDFRAHAAETAVVEHRGVRSYRTSYGELAELSGRFAAELERRGIVQGERVILWGANSASWISAFFGCVLRGVLAVPLDAAGAPEFVRRVLSETTPKLLVADRALLERLGEVKTPALLLDRLGGALPVKAEYAAASGIDEETAFQIVFTSGTTSEPKGIVHTHRNVLASLRPIEKEIEKYRRYERMVHPLRFLHTLPLSHVFGQFMGLWIPAILAAELHFTDTMDPGVEMRLIRRERISVLIAVPRVLGLLRVHLMQEFPELTTELERAAALPVFKRWWRFRQVHGAFGWKFWALISGGAMLPGETERFWNRLGFALIQGYGMTETAALVTLNHPFHIAQGTLGKPLPGREVRVSESGEVMVRGEMVSTATWQDGHLQPREGEWLATGDLAEQADTGELRFLGRQGDAIVTASGLNVYPQDVEAALARQAGVQGVVVVSCETGNGVEPVSVVLFNGEDEALYQAVLAANAELAEYQQIRRTLRWRDAGFPYTSTGKLLRREVQQWACAALREQAVGPSDAGDPVLALLAEAAGEMPARDARDEQRLSEDFHLDSLGRVQLGALLEQRLGVSVSEEALAIVQTLGELRVLVRASGTQVAVIAEHVRQPLVDQTAAARSDVSATKPRTQTAMAAVGKPEWYSYPHWPWSWPMRLVRVAFMELVVRPLIGLVLAPRVKRQARVPAGPVLVIANHVTSLDGALVLYALPRRIRGRLAIAMAGEMLVDFRRGRGQGNIFLNMLVPFAYWLVTALFNVFPLPRLRGFRESFEHAGAAMDRGYSVLVFPEGTRSHTGEILPFRQGIGLLAAQSHVPVLPVAMRGLHELATRKVRWFRPGIVEIRLGNTIEILPEQSAGEITKQLEAALKALLD